MSKRKTHNEFVEECKIKNTYFDDFDFITEYNGMKNKIGRKCKLCGHEWYTMAETVRMGSGCPICANIKLSKTMVRPLDDFLKELYIKRIDVEYVRGYTSMRDIAVFRCKKHDELFETTPQNILNGVVCKMCKKEKSRYNKLSEVQINESLKHLNIIIIGEYINSKTPTLFKCLSCGEEFISKYETIKTWKNIGCSKCRIKNRIIHDKKNNITLSTYKITKLHDCKSNYVEILEYNNDVTKIKCKCLICNTIYETSYDSLIQGSMHKSCASIIAMNSRRLSIADVLQRVESFGHNIRIDFSNYISTTSRLKCECMDCGHIWFSNQRYLTTGRGCPECAKIKRDTSKYKDLEFYIGLLNDLHLSVISEYVNATTPVLVKCDICGNTFETTMTYLSNCKIGCKLCSKEKTRIEKLEIFEKTLFQLNPTLKLVGDFVNMSTPTTFLCVKCNKTFNRTPHDLLKSYNCPNCTTNSKLEYFIKLYLDNNNIEYNLHKTFNGLYGINDGLLSYDFYLSKYNLLIEGQGEQHLRPINRFGGQEQFKIQQEHDKRKREYAKNNNIELLEIWYYDINNIESILKEKLHIDNIKKSA